MAALPKVGEESEGLGAEAIGKAFRARRVLGSGGGALDEAVPDLFLCPLSGSLMEDPVLFADGYCYERARITEWLIAQNHCLISPVTGTELSTTNVMDNLSLRRAIQSWKAQVKERN